MFQLLTLGGLSLTRAGEPSERSPIQRRQLALLAVLAGAGPGGVSRDKLMGLLWPDRELDRARSSLDQALYAARRVCGPDVFIASPTSLALNPSIIASDLAAFSAALAAGDAAAAVRAYGGPFLDGVFISDAAEFERWADGERARLAREYQGALETLARSASARGAADEAIQWWRRVVDADPLSSRAARGLIEALAAAGDRAGALDFARVHEALVRNELGASPDPTVVSLVEELRRAALPAASQATASSASTAIAPRSASHAVADERGVSPLT
ncbi:MAG: hypothetical protein IRY91_07915, partial [Gemmatimonadaceae bacterium]|nr:hypothetical protein [Gemmatimonadaceae bacterium]